MLLLLSQPQAREGVQGVRPLVWEGIGTQFKPRFSLCLDVISGHSPALLCSHRVQYSQEGQLLAIRQPLEGHCPRCIVSVVIMHIPEHGTACSYPGCLLVLFSGIRVSTFYGGKEHLREG